MKWGRWSTTAASNTATPPDGWPEGQLPSTVNDCAREMMAAIRTGLNDIAAGFVDLDFSPTYVSSTVFTTPTNTTAYLQQGTRIRASDATTLYGTIVSASFSTNASYTVAWDSGNITASLSSVAVSVVHTSNSNLPQPLHIDGVVSISATAVQGVLTIANNHTTVGTWLRCSAGAKMLGCNNSSLFYIANSSNSVAILGLTDAGALTIVGDITANSDERQKTDWKELPEDFVERLAAIRRSGTFLKDGARHVGVGAQSLLPVLEEAVLENDGGILSVAYGNAALASCVALARRVVQLEERLAQLEKTS